MAKASLGTSRAPVEFTWWVSLAGACLGAALSCLALMAGNVAGALPIGSDARLVVVALASLGLTGWCLSTRRLHARRHGLSAPVAEVWAGTLGWLGRQAAPLARRAFPSGFCLGLQGACLTLIMADVLLGVAVQGALRRSVALTLIGATVIGQFMRLRQARERHAAEAGESAGQHQDGTRG